MMMMMMMIQRDYQRAVTNWRYEPASVHKEKVHCLRFLDLLLN
jgi:hypothetical protein